MFVSPCLILFKKMKKKVLLYAGIAICLIIITAILLGNGKLAPAPINSVSSTTVQNQNCNPYSDISTVVKTGDTKACDCYADATQRSQCQGRISDATLYTSASNQSDLSMCNKISAIEMKNDCLKLVQAKIDFTNKSLKAAGKK